MKKKDIYVKFEIGEMVFCKTDPEQYERQVTGMLLRESRLIYKVTFNSVEDSFYGFELTSDEDILKRLR
jgi:hypothetical protein